MIYLEYIAYRQAFSMDIITEFANTNPRLSPAKKVVIT